MLTPGELAIFLQAGAVRARAELTATTKEFIGEVAQDAKARIGQERPEWKVLAESTLAEKYRLGFWGQVSGTDPLLREGTLRASISSEAGTDPDGAHGIVGSPSLIAAYQELGTSRIPPRPFLSSAMQQSEHKAIEAFGHLAFRLLNPGIR